MHELEQVLVQREQTQKTSGDGGVLVCFGGTLFAYFLRELGYVLAGEVPNFEEINGDTAAVSTTGPLGVLDVISRDQLFFLEVKHTICRVRS